MQVERTGCLEDRWLQVLRECGAPRALLVCTYTFDGEFFTGLLERFREEGLGQQRGERDLASAYPVDVVCDARQYRGHRVGFNVHTWSERSRLFHPKLLIGLFGDRVVWSSGSLNMTRAGWWRNRELALFFESPRHRLPRSLRKLIAALPQNQAAEKILKQTKDARDGFRGSTFVTSLERPIGPCFLRNRSERVSEIHLVAPFFDRKEAAENATIDAGWLKTLREACLESSFHIYLPLIDEKEGVVQGSCAIFRRFERDLGQAVRRLRIHPVRSSPGPLHGKLACLKYASMGSERARVLVGSPNMTQAGLLDRRGNIEVAWIADEPWPEVQVLLTGISTGAFPLRDVRFEAPELQSISSWLPLRSATLDRMKDELRIEWVRPKDAAMTLIRYAGKDVKLTTPTLVRDFEIKDSVRWLETSCRGADRLPGRTPIAVSFDEEPAVGHSLRNLDDCLRMLGAVQGVDLGSGIQPPAGQSAAEGDTRREPQTFHWSEMVRDLAARMRYLKQTVLEAPAAASSHAWTLKLFDKLVEQSSPFKAADDSLKVWHAWVRVELWQTARAITEDLGKKSSTRRRWRRRELELRRMSARGIPAAARAQFRALVKALSQGVT